MSAIALVGRFVSRGLMGPTPSPVPTFEVLGCAIHGVTREELTDLVDQEVGSGQRTIVANHNLHSLYCYHKDSKMQAFFRRARWIHADGMSVVLLGRLQGRKMDRRIRVTYVDWLPVLMARAQERKWRVFYLGSKPGVAERGAQLLRATYPDIHLECAHGYFQLDGEANARILARMRAFVPQVVMVGMGMPRQEHWIFDNLEQLPACVILPCGAAIDYVAGAVRTPPRWAGRWGLEWLFRMIAEPGRLWHRYLVEPWLLTMLLARRWFVPAADGKDASL